MNTDFLNWCRALMNRRKRALIVAEALGLIAVVAVFLFASPFVVQANLNRSLVSEADQNSPTFAGSWISATVPSFPDAETTSSEPSPDELNPSDAETTSSEPTSETRPGFMVSCGVELPIGGPPTPWRTMFVIAEDITNEDTIRKGDWITVFTTVDGKKDSAQKEIFAAAVLTSPDAKTKLGVVQIFESLDPSQGDKLKGQTVNVIFP